MFALYDITLSNKVLTYQFYTTLNTPSSEADDQP